jgi:hypothetical protein
MTDETTPELNNRHFGGFIPLLLFGTALLVLLVFQAIQLNRDRGTLKSTIASQETPFQESQRLRTQLDGVAADTMRLAQQGNANATAVVQDLASRGININLQGAGQAGQ